MEHYCECGRMIPSEDELDAIETRRRVNSFCTQTPNKKHTELLHDILTYFMTEPHADDFAEAMWDEIHKI